ncbi:MAG: gliding motility-associated C-terminal domain-containing protein [Bernardetiaceae bacterium]|nr:gliding motility-associated C-terminal domain-containing protein [Bernardetiaceae bacterium]
MLVVKCQWLGLLIACLNGPLAQAQQIQNYAFSTGTNASLLALPNARGLIGRLALMQPSDVRPLGFEFWFMGQRYTDFSVNSNGVVRLGPIQIVGGGNAYTIPNQARIVAFASGTEINGVGEGNWRVSNSGGIQYQVVGTAPERVMAIDCRGLSVNSRSMTADASFQILLHETNPLSTSGNAGRIEFRYGEMRSNVDLPLEVRTGIGSSDQPGTFLGVNIAGNNATTTTREINNPIRQGPIPTLNSPTEGARRFIAFNPPAPNGQVTQLRANCNTGDRAELSWTNNVDNAVGTVLYRSTNGTDFTFLAQVNKPQGNTYTDTGLQLGATYYYRAYAVTEGKLAPLHATASVTVKAENASGPTRVERAVCGTGSLVLDAGEGFSAYLWNTGATTRTITVNAEDQGAYSVKAEDACGRTNTIDFKVASLRLSIEGELNLCPATNPQGVTLTAPPGFATYQWRDEPGRPLGNGPSLQVSRPGTYHLTITVAGGCTAQASAQVRDCCAAELRVPNAFTPHTSPDNNLFRVGHQGLSAFKMEIYNRWGNLVFAAEDPETGWDGQLNGQKCPGGAYQVIIEYTGCIEGRTFKRRHASVLYLIE